MLTQRLFAHVSKKHHMTIPEYTKKFNINLFTYQNKGGYYKNGESRRSSKNNNNSKSKSNSNKNSNKNSNDIDINTTSTSRR